MSKIIEAAEYYMNEILDMTHSCPNHSIIKHTDRAFLGSLDNGIEVKFTWVNNDVTVDFIHNDTQYKKRDKQEWATITKVLDLLDCIVLQNYLITQIIFKTAEEDLDVIGTSPFFNTECLSVLTPLNFDNSILEKLRNGTDLYRTEYDKIVNAVTASEYQNSFYLFRFPNFWVVHSQRARIYLNALRKNFPNITFTQTVKGNFFYMLANQRII